MNTEVVKWDSMENTFSVSQKTNGGFTERGHITTFHTNCVEVSAFWMAAIVMFFLIDLIDRLASLCFLHPHFSQQINVMVAIQSNS